MPSFHRLFKSPKTKQQSTLRRSPRLKLEPLELRIAPAIITGDDSDNFLVGTAGIDEIRGFGGNDTIDGGNGADVLEGGLGNDVFVFKPEVGIPIDSTFYIRVRDFYLDG